MFWSKSLSPENVVSSYMNTRGQSCLDTCWLKSRCIPGSKWKAHQSEWRQGDTHKERDIFDSWVFWISLFLAKITVSCNCTVWVADGQEGPPQLITCFVSTPWVGMSVHQSAVSAVFFSFHRGEFLRKGVIGPAERNTGKTRKVIEHVTDSYHIDCLMEVNLEHWRHSAISNNSRNATSLQHQKLAFFHGSSCSRINEAVVLSQCVQRRKMQVYPPWNRTHRNRAKDHRTQSTVKQVLGMKAN